MTDTTETIVLDQPAQISGWFYLSAVSQLTTEIRTKTNYYGKVSAYSGIRGKIIPAEMLPPRATRVNKIMALTMLCWDQPGGPVIDAAREVLATVEREEGVAFVLDEA